MTQAIALGVDGHHIIEQSGRSAQGLLLNFNGSGGVIRKEAILDAGGWFSDTLSEDMDLSYRIQLEGWKINYQRCGGPGGGSSEHGSRTSRWEPPP